MQQISVFSPEEINAVIELVLKFITFVFATSVGTFTREMIYPQENTFKQNIGFSLLSAIVAFGLSILLENRLPKEDHNLALAYIFLLCVAVSFFLPAFKDWLKGKNIFRIIARILKKTNDLTTTIIDEVDKELTNSTKDKQDSKNDND